MSGWWQQPTWRTAASRQISSWWHLSYTLAPRIANYMFLWPRHMQASIHHPCTNHSVPSISAQTDWAWMLRNTFCPVCSTREDFFLLWDRKFIGVGSICHSCHQSQRVKVTACLAWSTSLQIPASPSGLFLRWYQRQCVTDEAITGLSLGSSCYLAALKTAPVFWK